MIIHDGGGNDTLVLAEEINETEIQLKRESNHLRVIITSEEHADVADNLRGVVFADYFTPSPVNKIEAIQVGENRYDTAKLVEAMHSFLSEKARTGDPVSLHSLIEDRGSRQHLLVTNTST